MPLLSAVVPTPRVLHVPHVFVLVRLGKISKTNYFANRRLFTTTVKYIATFPSILSWRSYEMRYPVETAPLPVVSMLVNEWSNGEGKQEVRTPFPPPPSHRLHVFIFGTPVPSTKMACRDRSQRFCPFLLPFDLVQFWTYAIFAMGLLEYRSITTAYGEPDPITGEGDLKEDYIPGNLGFDPLGMKPKNPTVLKSMETKELNNGRLAMIGIAGMLVQELVDPVNILNWI